jgi:hypothetical protein
MFSKIFSSPFAPLMYMQSLLALRKSAAGFVLAAF